jgi:undecaprenyl-diphosphatase
MRAWFAAAFFALALTMSMCAKVSETPVELKLESLDLRVLRSMRTHGDPTRPIGPLWLPEVARDITALGGVTIILMVTAAVSGFLILSRRTHSLVLVLGAVVGGLVLSVLLKEYFDRPRPPQVFHLTPTMSQSYPSGHAMMSAVTFLTLGAMVAELVQGRRRRIYIFSVASAVTFLIGLSRVYLGVHYPTDVIVGWATGLAWAAFMSALLHGLKRKSPIVAQEAS